MVSQNKIFSLEINCQTKPFFPSEVKRTAGFIESFHVQYRVMRRCTSLGFKLSRNKFSDLKGPENMIYTMKK